MRLKKDQKGFTIIEVLIVLAIAGLIMLIVFLAVPALQRNSRNTQRTNDASLISAAVNECLNNNNGQIGSCNNPGGANLDTYIDTTKLQQLTDGNDEAGINSYALAFGSRCDSTGSGIEDGDGVSSRSFTVTFETETSSGTTPRCVGS